MKCPKCEFENADSAKFCNECGHPLIFPSEETSSKPIPDAERKRITALSSDLSGYTAMSEKLDPEEVSQITGRIFDGIKTIVGKY